jgi:hypothetical protein
MSASVVSSTDAEVFRRLANPAVVDIRIEPRTRRATNDMRTALAKAACDVPIPEEPDSPARSVVSDAPALKSHFAAAQERAAAEAASSTSVFVAPSLPAFAAPATANSSASSPRQGNCFNAGSPKPARGPVPQPRVEETQSPRSSVGDASPAPGSEEERLEKQGFLIELANLKAKGVTLSRDFTLRDSLAEMEFELTKQTHNITTRNSVNFMRDMLRIIINGIEIGNSKFGPFVSIDGWAESVTTDMQKYDHCLERLYKRYWRLYQHGITYGRIGPANESARPPGGRVGGANDYNGLSTDAIDIRRSLCREGRPGAGSCALPQRTVAAVDVNLLVECPLRCFRRHNLLMFLQRSLLFSGHWILNRVETNRTPFVPYQMY